MVFLRNTTNQMVPVEVVANWRSQTAWGPAKLGTQQMAPQETRLLDLAKMQDAGLIPKSANWAGVSLRFYGREGDVMAISSSYDSAWKHGLQSPFSAQLAGQWAGSAWHADSNTNSLITTGNGGDQPTRAKIRINYEGGSYEVVSESLAPGEQFWVNVGELKQSQAPDSQGNVIPLSAVTGTYDIEDMNDPWVGTLFEGKLIVDKTFGHATYGCSRCCPVDILWLDPDPLSTSVGGGAQDDLWGENSCYGTDFKLTGPSHGWISSHTNIATMGSGKGWVNGISSGTSTITGYFTTRVDGPNEICSPQDEPGDGPGNVNPTVSITGPIGVPLGHSAGFTVSIGSNPGNVTITLKLTTTTGTGQATFNGGGSTKTLQGGATVPVNGNTASSTANNITLQALDPVNNVLASVQLSVVSVTLTVRGTGTVSVDNSALSAYSSTEGTTSLGAFTSFVNLGCYTGAELVGTVQPSSYTGSVVIRRTLLNWGEWKGTTQVQLVTTSSDDTSDVTLRDDDPHSGGSVGKAYDLDAPGIRGFTDQNVAFHIRQNFSEYAVLDNETNTVSVSNALSWYSAVSCTLSGGNYQLSTGITGDNKAAIGTVSLSWNLQ